jgi:hypothetical protein
MEWAETREGAKGPKAAPFFCPFPRELCAVLSYCLMQVVSLGFRLSIQPSFLLQPKKVT